MTAPIVGPERAPAREIGWVRDPLSERFAVTIKDGSGPSDAHLDPWCATPFDGGETLPIGFSLRHPRTGGLGWLVSTEVEEPDFDAGRAGTRSGRRYRLGRRFDAVDFGGEGDEAGTAFRYLLEGDFDGFGALRALDKLWLVSCKASRHLGLQHPPCRSADVRTFRVAPSSVPRGGQR